MLKNFEQFINEDYSFVYYLNKVEEEYFSPYKKIALDTNLEGYKVIDGQAYVGARIASKKNNTEALRDGLFHEMGHFVMTENFNRLTMYAFGMDYTTKDDLGYSIPISWVAIKNESKAILWQSLICKKFHIVFDVDDFIIALKYMEDFINVPLKGCFYKDYKWYYDQEFNQEVPYVKRDKLRLETVKDFLKAELKNIKYTIEEFDKRWHERCQWLDQNL